MIWSRDRWNVLSRGAARVDVVARRRCICLGARRAFGDGPRCSAENHSGAEIGPACCRGSSPRRCPDGCWRCPPATEDAWVKLCMKNEQTQNKDICLINHEGLEPNTGMVLIAAAVRKVEGEEKQQLLVRVPTAYALVMPAGVQLKIDEEQPIQLQYAICFPTSCQVQLELTKEMLDSMRKGKQMVVAAMNIQQKTMGFPVPLTGFSKAYDGPPVDSVKYEELRRQLMEMFRKRQQELAAKAKGAEQTGAAPAGAATAQQKAPAAPAQ